MQPQDIDIDRVNEKQNHSVIARILPVALLQPHPCLSSSSSVDFFFYIAFVWLWYLGNKWPHKMSCKVFSSIFLKRLRKNQFLFIYLAVSGLSWGMWDLVP